MTVFGCEVVVQISLSDDIFILAGTDNFVVNNRGQVSEFRYDQFAFNEQGELLFNNYKSEAAS